MHDIIRATLEGSPYNNITQTQYLVDSPLPIGAWNDIRSFVDDVSQTVRAKMPANKMMSSATIFARLATGNDLRINPKTVVLASKKGIGKDIVKRFRDIGIPTRSLVLKKELVP